MGDYEWTTDAAIRLIEEYRQKPELWDNTNDLYRVQTAKYDAWSHLARTFQCDIADLRKKLNSIFASHRREKAKIRAGGKSTWFLYPYMSFLPNHLENNNGHTEINTNSKSEETPTTSEESSSNSSDEDDDNDNNTVNDDNEEIVIKQEPMVQNHVTEDTRPLKRPMNNSTRGARPILKRTIMKEKENLDSRLTDTLKMLRKTALANKKDECETFGEYVATTLKKHDERTQSMIKQAINNILFEQEMKKYTAGQYTVLISGIDENPLILGDDKCN